MKILFVDDDADRLAEIRAILQDSKLAVAAAFAAHEEEAAQQLVRTSFDVLVAGVDSPRSVGARVVSDVEEGYPTVARLVHSNTKAARDHIDVREPQLVQRGDGRQRRPPAAEDPGRPPADGVVLEALDESHDVGVVSCHLLGTSAQHVGRAHPLGGLGDDVGQLEGQALVRQRHVQAQVTPCSERVHGPDNGLVVGTID